MRTLKAKNAQEEENMEASDCTAEALFSLHTAQKPQLVCGFCYTTDYTLWCRKGLLLLAGGRGDSSSSNRTEAMEKYRTCELSRFALLTRCSWV